MRKIIILTAALATGTGGAARGQDPGEALGCFDIVPETAVQIVAPQLAGPDANGFCSLRGEIARSFRGGFRKGETLRIAFPCLTGEAARAAGVPPLDPEPLRTAPVIEIHTETQGGEVATGQGGLAVVPLPGLTDAPVWADYLVLCT